MPGIGSLSGQSICRRMKWARITGRDVTQPKRIEVGKEEEEGKS
jgi:hypothetical protein